MLKFKICNGRIGDQYVKFDKSDTFQDCYESKWIQGSPDFYSFVEGAFMVVDNSSNPRKPCGEKLPSESSLP